jgi:hypothetical protein
MPEPEGRRVFTGGNQMIRIERGGVVDRNGAFPLATPTLNAFGPVYPSLDSAYHLRPEVDHRTNESSVSILLPTGESLLKVPIQRPGSPNYMQIVDNSQGKLVSKRVVLFPEHDLIVAVAGGENRLLPRRVALRDAVNRLNRPTVVSPSDVFASAGQNFNYQIRVLSGAGGVVYSLAKGQAPANMRVSEDGKVTWPVPQKSAGNETLAVIKVRDASGQEVLHRLDILVR